MTFSALLHQLPQDNKKHLVCRGSGLPETALCFRKHSFWDVLKQAAGHDIDQDFPCDGAERYSTVCDGMQLFLNVLDQEVLATREGVSSRV